jgi:hypothetical protein
MTGFELPADLVDDVRQRAVADHGRFHERAVEGVPLAADREIHLRAVRTCEHNLRETSSSPSRTPVPLAKAGPPPHKVITLSVAASVQLRSSSR